MPAYHLVHVTLHIRRINKERKNIVLCSCRVFFSYAPFRCRALSSLQSPGYRASEPSARTERLNPAPPSKYWMRRRYDN